MSTNYIPLPSDLSSAPPPYAGGEAAGYLTLWDEGGFAHLAWVDLAGPTPLRTHEVATGVPWSADLTVVPRVHGADAAVAVLDLSTWTELWRGELDPNHPYVWAVRDLRARYEDLGALLAAFDSVDRGRERHSARQGRADVLGSMYITILRHAADEGIDLREAAGRVLQRDMRAPPAGEGGA